MPRSDWAARTSTIVKALATVLESGAAGWSALELTPGARGVGRPTDAARPRRCSVIRPLIRRGIRQEASRRNGIDLDLFYFVELHSKF